VLCQLAAPGLKLEEEGEEEEEEEETGKKKNQNYLEEFSWVSASVLVQPIEITRTQYTKCRLCSVS
jgi:hypothetical protein